MRQNRPKLPAPREHTHCKWLSDKGTRWYQNCRAIKPEIPVVMLSALPSLPANARSVDAFVTKGQSPELWLDVLAALLDRRSGIRVDQGVSAFPLPAAA